MFEKLYHQIVYFGRFLWGKHPKQVGTSSIDEMSPTDYDQEIIKVLEQIGIPSKQYSYVLHLYVSKSNKYNADFEKTYGEEPMAEATLFSRLGKQKIRDRFAHTRILVKLESVDRSQMPERVVVLEERFFSSDFELKVYIHNLQPQNLVETLPIPTQSSFTVGRADATKGSDVNIGQDQAATRYPPLQSDRSRSILYMLSRRAFTIHHHNNMYWGCQSRKQGQFIVIKNDISQKTVFPLDHPERKALYREGDYIVVFSNQLNNHDRILFQIVPKSNA